jgi:succinate dehydrogenase / fumarate reductase iron-sulfur subunit
MVAQMDREGFGNCSNCCECEAEIPATVIAKLNREYAVAGAKDAVGVK